MTSSRLFAFIAACPCILSSPVKAQSYVIATCETPPLSFLFFNGVRKTRPESIGQLGELTRVFGSPTSNGRRISYDVAYNTSRYVEGSVLRAGWNDFIETYEQRLAEQSAAVSQRYELFWEAANGGGQTVAILSAAISALPSFFQSLATSLQNRLVTTLSSMRGSNITFSNYAQHREQVDTALRNQQKLLLYGHSQGSLFANQAYLYARQRASDPARIVYAAPAAATVYGDYTLAQLDLVINVGLRALGSVQPANVNIAAYENRPAGVVTRAADGMLSDGRDALGHGLLEIYLNRNLATFNDTRTKTVAALNELSATAPTNNGRVFDVSLTYQGTGDAQIAVRSPAADYRYFSANYAAACSATPTPAGDYDIAVQPYSTAAGQRVTVAVSVNGTQLRSATLTLPDPRSGPFGIVDPIPAFKVRVAANQNAGTYTVSLL